MHPEASEVVARALAPLLDHAATQRAEVPHLCRLLDLLQLAPHPSGRDLAERWQHSDGRPTTVLGLSNSGPVEIDLAADGPHLLIAGTTGAGKSELLQSLVVGLAANHPPESVSFVLIDYKGGAAFAECAPLPHVAGMVTDLDPSLTDRALQAFECELRRRERLFVPVGAADLNAYRATPGVPHLPRLIIVIDEFAALAEDAPELLHGLVSVAQRGRSLGIQLVLATQRPAGIVSADIRANTSLRIALRVNDTSESIDVIGTGDAATIDPTHAGRAIMVRAGARTGIQIAQVSGQVARDPLRTGVVRLMPWRELPDDTQPGADATDVPDRDIRVLVRAIGAAAAITQRPPAPCPWLPPLPDLIADADLPAPPRTDVVHFGLVDQPRDQAQAAALVDLGTGGTIVFAGAARTGRTTGARCLALRAAAQLTAAQLRVYAVGSGVTDLAGLPHCVEAVDLLAFETVATLLRRMSVDLQRRRDPRAQIELLIIDGWEEFAAASDQADHGCSTDIALDIARRAGSARLTVVITGDRAALGARVTSTAMVTYALRLSDRADYGLIGIDPRRVPAHMPAGRALRAPGGEQVQFAQPSGINPCGGTGDRSAVRTSP
jgi:S-DNA-T family DNA segregation ATPase FtsK/SpoIIIE